MADESMLESGKKIAGYLADIRRGDVVTSPRDDNYDLEEFLDYDDRTDLSILVADSHRYANPVTQQIARNSLRIAYGIQKKLDQTDGGVSEYYPIGKKSICVSVATKLPRNIQGKVFQEGAIHIQLHMGSFDANNRYDIQLNFRELKIQGEKKLAVILESIHKGQGKENMARNLLTAIPGADGARDDLEDIKEANKEVAETERELGCSMNELAFDTAFAFARGIGADVFMATDDAAISTKQHYAKTRQDNVPPYSPNNWVYQKNGLHPPKEGECYWVNPYPNRLQSESLSLNDALLFYNSSVPQPDRYRDYPKGISAKAINLVAQPFEQFIHTAMAAHES